MNEFVNWSTLATYGGALTMVLLLTQFTKDLFFTKKIPTQIWSYILAFGVLILAHAFTSGLTPSIVAETLFNAVVISMAANGGYSAVTKIAGISNTDGDLFIDTSNPVKDTYRLDVGSLDALQDKKTITLKVTPKRIYNNKDE